MAVLRKRIAPGLMLLHCEGYPFLASAQRLRRGEKEVWLGIGGNVGDVLRRFRRLLVFLGRRRDLRVLESSPVLINPPFGYLDQTDFYNAVLRIATSLPPEELLRRLQEIAGWRCAAPHCKNRADRDSQRAG